MVIGPQTLWGLVGLVPLVSTYADGPGGVSRFEANLGRTKGPQMGTEAIARIRAGMAPARSPLGARALAGVLALVLSGVGCSPFEGVGSAADRGDAGDVDGGPRGALRPSTPASGCELAHPPSAPETSEQSGALEIVVVANRINAGDLMEEAGPGWAHLGYDVDDRCSDNDGSTHSCIAPDWPRDPEIENVDGEGGIDNAIGAGFFVANEEGLGETSKVATTFAENGARSFIVRVRGYNGQADDDRVSVSMFAVTTSPSPGEPAEIPAFDGFDRWYGYETCFVDEADAGVPSGELPAARYTDTDAYVRGHRLVARFPIIWSVHGMLSRYVISATLREEAGGYTLRDGVASGRLRHEDVLGLLGRSVDPVTFQRLCIGNPRYERRKQILCSLIDASYDGPDDGSRVCDAATWAYGFEAVPAILAGVVPWEPTECEPGDRPGVDDSCHAASDAGSPP